MMGWRGLEGTAVDRRCPLWETSGPVAKQDWTQPAEHSAGARMRLMRERLQMWKFIRSFGA